jgi:diguanylate cyclase (GGDEF)-like protein
MGRITRRFVAVLGEQRHRELLRELEARLRELEAERQRLRDAIARFGEVLAATHDSEQLMRVIVETAVEATRASAGILAGEHGELVRVGKPAPHDSQLEIPLQAGRHSFGSLVLYAPAFDVEERMTAVSLAAHAAVGLDNARLHRIVERQALVDGLTGLANRRHCEEVLAAEVSRSERFGTELAVVAVDLDDFKRVNDRHGHPCGDFVLRELAIVLRETLREIDVAARWGGEEFLLVLPGTNQAGALRLAERVRLALAERTLLAPDGSGIDVTASLGVANHRRGQREAELVADADAALYEAKRAGKNRVSAPPTAAQRP